MGLHTGRAAVAGDGYVGLAVHHAARVAQAAHGGEIIASESTVASLDSDSFAAHDLGDFELRGIPCATRLFRIVAPDLQGDFPQPNARPSMPATVRVVLADDSVLLREGIAALLDQAGLEVVGQAGTATDLLDLIESTLPDIAIVDIRMPPTKTDEGIRAAATIRSRHPRTSVLLLSSHVDVENALSCLPTRSRVLATCSRNASPTSTSSSPRCIELRAAERRSTARSWSSWNGHVPGPRSRASVRRRCRRSRSSAISEPRAFRVS